MMKCWSISFLDLDIRKNILTNALFLNVLLAKGEEQSGKQISGKNKRGFLKGRDSPVFIQIPA
jgi:hypothetical protein